jgi:hypothetical protein
MLPVPADRQHPPSPLDTIAAVLRGAVEAEVHPQWSVIGELRAALDGYETAIRLAAEARVAAKVAVAIGLPAPEVPAASEARRVLTVAMHAVAASALVFTEPGDAHGGGDGPVGRDTGREPPCVEPPQVNRAEHDAERLVPAVDNGGGAVAAVEVIDRATEPPSAVENSGSAAKKNGPVLSQEAVRAYFEARAAAPPPSRPTSKYAQEADALRTLVRQAGQVVDPASDPGGVQELDALDEITADTSIWLSLSTPVQHLWLSYLVALLANITNRGNWNSPTGVRRPAGLRRGVTSSSAWASCRRPA